MLTPETMMNVSTIAMAPRDIEGLSPDGLSIPRGLRFIEAIRRTACDVLALATATLTERTVSDLGL